MVRQKVDSQKQKPRLEAPPRLPVASVAPAPEAGPKDPMTSAVHPEVQPSARFPVVGIGASAGGLAAFEAFFSGMPVDSDPGMAFVLVQHLAPDHESILTGLIRRYTRMEVFEIEDGMVVAPNCTYIIPPGHDLAFLNGTLQLLEPAAPRGQRLPIDFFFRSLAQDQHERAIGIVLSGTGSDGTQGVRAIKGEGGLVLAQTPASTEYDGMPRSAIATGLVDFELPPAEMPAQLIAYAARAFGPPPPPATVLSPNAENAQKKIFVLLRARTGHDFSGYKPSTVHRRIARRMAVHQIDTLDRYVRYAQQTPGEVDALFRDLLIGVTSFFRDPVAFAALEEQVVPGLFAGRSDRGSGATIRVWSPGCSTGEEAYSLAILLAERQETLKKSFTVQVFATDIDAQAIATARAGLYPASIAGDLSPERLARFFVAEPEGSGYRIHKGIRDLLVFSEQDVIKDPPFGRLDLISCRNLLIYLGGELQKKLIPLFHYALNPDGVLFLGTSETVGEFEELFAAVDRKSKLYRRKGDLHGSQRVALGRFLAPATATAATAMALRPGGSKAALPVKLPLRELTEQALLQQAAPAAALVDEAGDILYLHGRTGMYLEPAPGEAGINNLLKMAREGLRHELTVALRKARESKAPVRCPGVRVRTNGDFTLVNLIVRLVTTGPSASLEAPLYLVTLEEALPPDGANGGHSNHNAQLPGVGGRSAEGAADLEALRQELRAKEEFLRTASEELETSNEELKSSNEEMQSVNEELQSSNEELQTSREEMQSVNEELATINAELQTSLAELARTNNDLNNLIGGTGIGTVFVDHRQRILRFTPTTTRTINLILGDVGRPIGHLVPNLVGYDSLVADTQAVLDTLIPREVEVQTREGSWYRLRIQPYRTVDNVIEGAVITFVDITEMVKTREDLRKTNELLRLAVVVRDASDAITVQDLEGRILAWNPGAVRMYGWSEAEALTLNVRDRIPQGLREEAMAKIRALSLAEVLEPYRTRMITKGGSVVEVSITSTALVNEAGKMYAIATTERARAPEPGMMTE